MMSEQMSNFGRIFPSCANPEIALLEREKEKEILFC